MLIPETDFGPTNIIKGLPKMVPGVCHLYTLSFNRAHKILYKGNRETNMGFRIPHKNIDRKGIVLFCFEKDDSDEF